MQKSESRWFWLVIALLAAGLLYLLSPILTPFIAAAFFAYLGDPIVDRLEVKRIPRSFAVSLVFVVILLLLLLLGIVLVPQIEAQISQLLEKIPLYLEWARNNILPWITERFGQHIELIDLSQVQQLLANHWKEAGGIVSGVVGQVSRSGFALLGWLANLVLIPVLTFYLLRDWDNLVAGIHALLPRHVEITMVQLAKESDDMLGSFLRGQLLVMTALGVIYTTGLWLVGLDFALLIGIFAGIVSFVPYLGLILGIVLAGMASILQFKGIDMLHWVALVFIIGQMTEGMFLTPKLVGDRIGLHPVAVIFSVMAGGTLYGFFGILLALPVAAVAMVLIRHAVERYRGSHLYHGGVVLQEEATGDDESRESRSLSD